MSDIFISHVEEDSVLALQIAEEMENAGYTTWHYERNSLPGPTYLEQVSQEIERSRVMILIISPRSLESVQVGNEVIRAFESAKPIIPVLHDIKHAEFQQQKPVWRQALGAATSIRIPKEGLPAIIPRILGGLKNLGVEPGLGYENLDQSIKLPSLQKKYLKSKTFYSLLQRPKLILGTALSILLVILVISVIKLRPSPIKQIQKETYVSETETKGDDSQTRVNELIGALADNFRQNRYNHSLSSDDQWSSKPITMVFMDIQYPKNSESAKDEKLINLLYSSLSAKKGINMVEREILMKLLQELRLSSSDLADPVTSLKLGRVLSARFIVTGRIMSEGAMRIMSLRFIDTETTEVRKVILEEIPPKEIDGDLIKRLNEKIIQWIRTDFPLKGRIISVTGNKYEVNLGRLHGIGKGDKLEVLKEHGKDAGIFAAVGEIRIDEVGEKNSWASGQDKRDDIKKGAKVRAEGY